MEKHKQLSKFLSFILRHNPQSIGLSLDKNGWAEVESLLVKMNNKNKEKIDIQMLKELVDTDSKNRYSFNSDFTKIRANQGHSIDVDVELKPCVPPKYLYHGTNLDSWNKIKKEGLKSMNRQYIHLSDNIDTAVVVAKRRKGKVVIIEISAKDSFNEGDLYYLSENKVWLSKEINKKFYNVIQL